MSACLSLLALSGHIEASSRMPAFEGKPDIGVMSAYDPN